MDKEPKEGNFHLQKQYNNNKNYPKYKGKVKIKNELFDISLWECSGGFSGEIKKFEFPSIEQSVFKIFPSDIKNEQ